MTSEAMAKKREDILDNYLADLNLESSADVATFLRRRRIKGVRKSYVRCPIAVYLSKKTKARIRVDGDNAMWGSGSLTAHAALPFPVTAFVEDFDGGCYPKLEVRRTKKKVVK